MFLKTWRSLQGVLFILAVFFCYQAAVFFFHSLRDLHRGQNGVTKGLVFLSGGLTLAGILNIVETIYKFFRRDSIEQ